MTMRIAGWAAAGPDGKQHVAIGIDVPSSLNSTMAVWASCEKAGTVLFLVEGAGGNASFASGL